MPHLFVMDRLDFFTLCVHMMFGTLTHVKGIWTLYLAGKQRSQVAISLTLCWGCCELWGQLARVLSTCLWVCTCTSSFSKRSLTLALITEEEALPWHHFDTQVFLIQAQGKLLQLKPNCLQFFGLTARMRALLCMVVFPRASPHASVYVALSPLKIADKCRSLCLASLCMCTQWLGLQAVVQD